MSENQEYIMKSVFSSNDSIQSLGFVFLLEYVINGICLKINLCRSVCFLASFEKYTDSQSQPVKKKMNKVGVLFLFQ